MVDMKIFNSIERQALERQGLEERVSALLTVRAFESCLLDAAAKDVGDYADTSALVKAVAWKIPEGDEQLFTLEDGTEVTGSLLRAAIAGVVNIKETVQLGRLLRGAAGFEVDEEVDETDE